MAKALASQGGLADMKIAVAEIGEGLFDLTDERDPNSGVIIGHDSLMVVGAHSACFCGDGYFADRGTSTLPDHFDFRADHGGQRTCGARVLSAADDARFGCVTSQERSCTPLAGCQVWVIIRQRTTKRRRFTSTACCQMLETCLDRHHPTEI